ncbi:hypothetical protein [Selenomonas sp. F0473]|uniref:hypothetical protein n=1 Tax=Selenomonas sp. F0473 TaxID=999423 RepID=UPI00029E797C|nr:hypothetical protein [Selenomonas sp. F0473]EKU70751.1 hypothetical protein HMPREF9161_01797 [Selenomonas sp. F0473]
MKNRIGLIFLIIACLLSVSIAFLYRFPFRIQDPWNSLYVGFFRYEMPFSQHMLWDKGKSVSLESFCFSYRYEYPNIYTYGASGYTKLCISPFREYVEKVVNSVYYKNNPELYGSNAYSSLEELQYAYGDKLRIKINLKNLSSEDQNIFLELKKEVEETPMKMERYLKRYNYDEKKDREVIEALKWL